MPPRLSKGPFLPPWCLPGASQAVQSVLSCLPGASQAVPNGPFLHPWCLPGNPKCLPDASRAVQRSFPAWCLPGVQMLFCSLPGARSTGSSSKGFRGTDSSSKGPRGLATRVDSRFWTGTGFCLNFSTTSMATARFAANPGVGPTVGCP